MNYLIQAYACSPDKGGEFAISWGWITHLNQIINEDDNIYVISLTLKQEELNDHGLRNVHLIPIEGLEKYNFLHFNNAFHFIWLKKAYKAAKKSGIQFDFVHIYSLSDYRKPGKWYKFKKTFTVLGPVGGAQDCPKSLLGYDTKAGKIRRYINQFYRLNPFYRHKISRFNQTFACNYETQLAMPGSQLLPDIPLREEFKNLRIEHNNNGIPVILYCGRLINKKGLMLLLDVLSEIPQSIKYVCHIYGDGEQKEQIALKIQELQLQDRVKLKGFIDYSKMSEIYRGGSIFVMPSLRESGGSVLIEAAAHKLPIVALNIGLARILKEHGCGLFVNTEKSKEEIIKEFSYNLIKLIDDPKLREELGSNGYNYVNEELNWDRMIQTVYKDNINRLREN